MDIAAFAHLGDHVLSEPSQIDISRRAFLKAGAAAGGGLLLGFALPFETVTAATGIFAPNAFVRIDSNGAVTLIMPQVEMGARYLYFDADADSRGAGDRAFPNSA